MSSSRLKGIPGYITSHICLFRNLREARDMAISERERAQISERETNTKYEQMLQEYVFS